ncbi:MAG: hypothetical protein ACRD2L_00110, partial [Terriglobia bacterium]
RKDIVLAWKHYTSYTNPTTRVEITTQALAYRISLPSRNSILRRCKKAFHKLLRLEHLRAFSTLLLVDFTQSNVRHLPCSIHMIREPRPSHQYHRVFSGATASRVVVAQFHQLTNH